MLTNIRVFDSPPRHGCRHQQPQLRLVGSKIILQFSFKSSRNQHPKPSTFTENKFVSYLEKICELGVAVGHMGLLIGNGHDHVSQT
jgi:hypothetical protein